MSFYQCGDSKKKPNQLFTISFTDNKKVFKLDQEVEVSITSKGSITIDSVGLKLGNTLIGVFRDPQQIDLELSGQRLGEQPLRSTIHAEGEQYELSSTLTLLATEKATLYTYEILETYPHDPGAYTQGLEFYNDTLYESTGQYRKSTLRKTDYTTGEVLQQVELDDAFFGEGITILNDRIYQLTWREKTGFIYDLKTLEKKGTFVYGTSAEGWGLCNDGTRLYKSDGSERIWILDKETLAESDHIQIYTNSSKIPRVNELEWVDGKIYANIYQKDAIAIVNPKNGAVEGVIDLSDLKNKVKGNQVDVLNGIAYNNEPGVLYVTGKNWDKLFKIRLVEK
jgi:glutamine cyclotransferase